LTTFEISRVDGLNKMPTVTRVRHRGQRAGWLRAAVLGANDGIVSVASVAIGVIAAGASTSFVLTAAIAALVAGAMAMAAGEYVSVSSQRDVEQADLDQERGELKAHPEGERQELAAIYVKRGLPVDLAGKVAEALTAQGFEVDKRQIQLKEPLKSIGEFPVTVKVFRDVTAEITVHIEKEV